MASSSTLLCFLLCLSLFSLHVHARESHFFSKFYPYTTTATTTAPTITTTTNNNVEEPKVLSKKEGQPTFNPKAHGGYGFHGPNMDQEALLPSSNTPSNAERVYNTEANSEYTFNGGIPHSTNNKNYKEYRATYQDNGFGNDHKRFNNYRYLAEQQGKSDTRSLKNGKYFYDLSNKKTQDPIPQRPYTYRAIPIGDYPRHGGHP